MRKNIKRYVTSLHYMDEDTDVVATIVVAEAVSVSEIESDSSCSLCHKPENDMYRHDYFQTPL